MALEEIALFESVLLKPDCLCCVLHFLTSEMSKSKKKHSRSKQTWREANKSINSDTLLTKSPQKAKKKQTIWHVAYVKLVSDPLSCFLIFKRWFFAFVLLLGAVVTYCSFFLLLFAYWSRGAIFFAFCLRLFCFSGPVWHIFRFFFFAFLFAYWGLCVIFYALFVLPVVVVRF